MPAAVTRTLLAAVSVALLAAVTLAGSAGGTRPGGPRDRVAPSDPVNLHVLVALPSAVVIGWDPSRDNVGVAGYYVYWDYGRATVLSPSHTVSGLGCGQATTISVAAFDRAGNRSSRMPATISTAACPDTQPPTAPSGFSQAATTENEVVLAWNPSSDDVGVVGYGVYRNLARIASPAEPTVTLSGLACGSTYTYAVDAADAAGNRSLLGTAYVQTAPCSDGQPPSAPTDLAVRPRRRRASRSPGRRPATMSASPATTSASTGPRVYNGTQTSATLSDLACGVTYAIGVDAFDACGQPVARAPPQALPPTPARRPHLRRLRATRPLPRRPRTRRSRVRPRRASSCPGVPRRTTSPSLAITSTWTGSSSPRWRRPRTRTRDSPAGRLIPSRSKPATPPATSPTERKRPVLLRPLPAARPRPRLRLRLRRRHPRGYDPTLAAVEPRCLECH